MKTMYVILILAALAIATGAGVFAWWKFSAVRQRWAKIDTAATWYAVPPPAEHPDRAEIERFTRMFMPEHYRAEDWRNKA